MSDELARYTLEALHRIETINGRALAAQLERHVQALLDGDPRHRDPKRLNRFEFKAYSQFGEDGILQEIFRRIGTTNRAFIEFGVESGLESNTAYLLLQGWAGLWLECVPAQVAAIRTNFAAQLAAGQLRVVPEAVTAENVEALFRAGGAPAEPDLLSVDIDGNDYWVWRAVRSFAPRVVAIEYNATFPPPAEWVMAYDVAHRWDGTVTFGASLQALERLGREKGYALVGCSIGGANAFFVRTDLVGEHFADPFTAANHFEPARYYLVGRHAGHGRSGSAFAKKAPTV